MNYQRRTEWIASLYLYLSMMLAGVTAFYSRNTPVLDQFAADWNVNLSFNFYAIFCLLGAIWAVFILLPAAQRIDPFWRRGLYLLGGMPLLAYTIPVGWFITRTGGNLITAAIYFIVLFSFVVITIATYRPRERV